MKTKKKKNINKYFVGGTINNILDKADSILQLGTIPFHNNNVVSGTEAIGSSIQNVITGAKAGAELGSIIPGVGTALGGGIGAAVGVIGKKGNIQSNGFYEDPTLNLGTGLIGAFKNKGLRKKYQEEKRRVAGNRFSLSNTQQLQTNWQEDYDNDIYTMANGGQIPSSLAYVDDGELISTPDGNLLEVPENGNPTDSNLVSLPQGSRVLSDTLKVPGTKKTFAQMGKELMSKKNSKNKDKYAENSAKLNKINDQLIHDTLFNFQEAAKIDKISRKYKNGIQTAEYGDEIGMSKAAVRALSRYPKRNYYRDKFGNIQYEPRPVETNINPNADVNKLLNSKGYILDEFVPTKALPQYNPLNLDSVKYDRLPVETSINIPTQKTITKSDIPKVITYSNNTNKKSNKPVIKTARNKTTDVIKQATFDNTVMPKLQGIKWGYSSIPNTPISYKPRNKTTDVVDNNRYQPTDNKRNSNWLNTLNKIGVTIGKLSPVISNLLSDPETFNTIDNPYVGSIMESMSGRRYNIDPAIRAVRDNISISNYNADRMNPNTGANMAYRLQNAIIADKAISDLYYQKNNIDNQYMGDYANTLNTLGQQNVAARNLSIDQNARSKAASRNINRAGWSQLSNYLQNEELMGNQMTMDKAMLDLYKPFLEAGYKTSDIANFMNKYRNR